MTGKNCVAIASDTRLGLQQQTVACDFQKVTVPRKIAPRAAGQPASYSIARSLAPCPHLAFHLVSARQG